MRSQGEEANEPPYCDAPPDTRYTRTLEKTLEQSRKECPDEDDYHRTWKERLLCGHIPSPCDNEDSSFRSPLMDKAKDYSLI
jgi:hypothetical protein